MENTITAFGFSINLTLEIRRLGGLQSTEELIKPLKDESAQRLIEILGSSEEPVDNQEDLATRLRRGNMLDEIVKITEEYKAKLQNSET